MLLKRYHCLGPVRPWQLVLDLIDCDLGMHCLPEGQGVGGKRLHGVGGMSWGLQSGLVAVVRGKTEFRMLWLRWGLSADVGGIRMGNVRARGAVTDTESKRLVSDLGLVNWEYQIIWLGFWN